MALAPILLADPPAQLLVLDEPTTNLDRESVDQLVDTLAGYRGALLIVSHDDAFLGRLDLTTTLALDEAGTLTEVRRRCGAGGTGRTPSSRWYRLPWNIVT